MNRKEQYTMKKNPETQTVTPNFKCIIVKHQVPLFHQTLPTQNTHHMPLLSGHLIHTTLTRTGKCTPVTFL